MPYPRFHACRLKSPTLFRPDSFRTLYTKTKGLSYIVAILKSTGKQVIQSYRYAKANWTATRARKHCINHGGTFEPAREKAKKALMPSDIPNLLESGANTAFMGNGEKGLAYKMCIIENIKRGDSIRESKKICECFKQVSLDEVLEAFIEKDY